MTTDTPIFCGQEPSFMGGALDTEEQHSDRTQQAQKLSGNPINKNKESFTIYFHGELESMMGFDIVSFVDGTFPKIKFGDRVKCIAITPDGKKHKAVTYVGHYKTDKHRLYCLVLLKSEKLTDQTKHELGLVSFVNNKEE
jgi:hypothetical protein